jgi:glycogen synthase
VRRIGNRQVFLAGWRLHEELPQALNAADALVLPSVAEAFGLVLVEAMACGLPVIACRTPGPAAIVADGGTGWLIRPDDEDALVDALVVAAFDEEERRARGRRAQTESRRYGWGRSLLASRPCTRSCLPPLPGRRLRKGGALDRTEGSRPFKLTSRSPISQRLPRFSNATGSYS